MNVTKYADLNQSLKESEKQLYDKISEECASSFEIAIHDSIQKIKSNADSMAAVVDKVQSCKDSYGEAAELVQKLSVTLADTEKKVKGLNSELVQLSDTAGSSTSGLSEKISKLLELSDDLIVKNKENEIVIEDTCKNIQKLGEEYSSSIESAMKDAKELEALLTDLKEKKNLISSEIQSIQENQITITCCVNDVKNSTAEYMGIVEKVNSSLMESFNVFKNDFISSYDEQSRIIEELKEEQVKLKKMYMLGIIPVIIIILLQIVNIIC